MKTFNFVVVLATSLNDDVVITATKDKNAFLSKSCIKFPLYSKSAKTGFFCN